MAVFIVKKEGGDLDHARAISRALNLTNNIYIYPNEDILDFCPAAKLIISVGSMALKFLRNLDNLSNMCVYWGAHQLTKDDKDALAEIGSYINVIALPAGVVESYGDFLKNFAQITFVKTIAVPTLQLSNQELWDSYNGLYKQYPRINLDKNYIIVSLPGDAPDSNDNWKEFDEQSVEDLSDMVQYVWSQQTKIVGDVIILVENSRRTGRSLGFDHKYYKDIDESIDESIDNRSAFFISLLEKKGIKCQFYPFAFQVNSEGEVIAVVSAHKALIYTAIETQAIYIVPGESTTQMGEIPQYIKDPERVIVFSPSSQNDAHKASMWESYNAGFISIWNDTKTFSPVFISEEERYSDVDKVVDAITGCLNANALDIYE